MDNKSDRRASEDADADRRHLLFRRSVGGDAEIERTIFRKLTRKAFMMQRVSGSAAPFHVPHQNIYENQGLIEEKDTNIIYNLRKRVAPQTDSKKELRKRDPPKKRRAKFSEVQAQTQIFTDRSLDDESIYTRKQGPENTDLIDLIQNEVSKYSKDEFVYLTYSVPKSSEFFTPYSLMLARYSQIEKTEYFTLSRHGVTYWSNSENHFTKLDIWLNEYYLYCNLIKIKSFYNFRIWKSFKFWSKGIKYRKFQEARRFIGENLFLVTPPLAKAILQMRTQYCKFIEVSFIDPTTIEDFHLFYFIEAQMATYESARDSLLDYRSNMTAVLYEACYNAITAKGFLPHDEALIYTTAKKLREMMSFTDRARKRRYCILLSNFLNYCDYMTITFLHIMLHKSMAQLSSIFQLHDEVGPTWDQLATDALDEEIESPRPSNKPQIPLFLGELVLKPTCVEVDPPHYVVKHILHQLIDLIESAINKIPRFQSDSTYNQFTEPSIMGRQEERLCGKPASIKFILGDDKQLKMDRDLIFEIIDNAFQKTVEYVKRFEPIRTNYEIDFNTDPKTITSEKDLKVLRGYCERYNTEMEALEGILPSINIGLLQLKQGTFKAEVIPVCHELLVVLDNHIPQITYEYVDHLKERAEELMIKMTTMPETTIEYVHFMRYIDTCEQSIEDLIADVDYAYECFMLMKDFDIPVQDEEKEKYMDTEDMILECREVRAEQLEKKPIFVELLAGHLQEDIKFIFDEVELINVEIVKPWLIDDKSDKAQVKEELQGLYDRLINAQQLSQEYRKYQREFRIDVTRFDALDACLQEVRYRIMLWESLDEWNAALNYYHNNNFHSLDMETIIELNMKIIKNCTLLEKNIPKNNIVPRLRKECEAFKEKIPTIGYLRNNAIKTRHWITIEQALGTRIIGNENLTLTDFEESDAFSEANAQLITEVSGQASAEAGLEILLRKVENAWKEFELMVVPHRDAKDVYILAGMDELQAVLDESNININTIAASRHVGPIKSRVDEWVRLMDIFAQTLDEWMTCQTSWIYLEAIFSAPDIQRQLPNEARKFAVVDKHWKDTMRKVAKIPLALPNMTNEQTLEDMKMCNVLLDEITKCLEAYLEVKRVAFPRFYFLSNDELLEILAQTKNPHAVQPHLRKCFDAIAKLEFGTKEGGEGGQTILTTDIVGMISPEGEKIVFGRGLKARGPVEDWLGKVEEAMFVSLKRCMKFAYTCYPNKDRSEWFMDHASQIVLTVSQQQWALEVHAILDGPDDETTIQNMKDFDNKLVKNLSVLASIARTDINPLLRKVLCALITVDVHAKDSITSLVVSRVSKSTDFNWLRMLRYYWMKNHEVMQARMSSAVIPYFYEYLGAGGVLVITPLTDRCFMCLMGAVQMDLGGAPAGPAGTGKTETTKDLAKALAKQCVVFNCSDGLDYKMMGRFFSGLAQSGAWCCFDEFNRIDIEVLSVIAQQLITIRNAKAMRLKRFHFEGREIKLDMACAAFITMNPGYAGRTELPDNLKALFRPIAMMVPDYALIAEVILYSEGFEASKVLSRKMTQMYKLCSEQLSQQDHYDFGMRAVKSVLVMAGALKRASPDQREDITLIAALRDSNLPKFLADDAVLFKGILGDLFPGVELPVANYGALEDNILYCMHHANLQSVPELVLKNIQLYETMNVRWGVMLVGPTGGGKTSVLHTLACALTKCWKDNVPGPNFRNVRMQTMNPKSISADELYGFVNLATLEWKDGLLGMAVRFAVNIVEEEHQWIVCDGPVDAVWIENLNTVLDDNKMLCLANSERIKLTPWVHMVFEVQDLAQASPATVSRCGMVYIDPGELGWMPLIQSWLQQIPKTQLSAAQNDSILRLFQEYFDQCLIFARRNGFYAIHQVEVSKVSMLCTIIGTTTKEVKGLAYLDSEVAMGLITKLFIWGMLWSIGGNFVEKSRVALEEFLKKRMNSNKHSELPNGSLWDYKVNLETYKWQPWSEVVDKFNFNSEIAFFEMLVPTTDTAKFGYVSELLYRENKPVMFTGETGVGKSVLAKAVLNKLSANNIIPVFLNFSAQTSSLRTQEMMEARLERRKRTLLGAPFDKIVVIFVDDVNMPKLDTYGSQPPIELLRQFLDFHGLYDRDKLFWKDIVDVVLGCACAPPGGGRNPLTPRFVRHFALLLLPPPSIETLTAIFSAIMRGFLFDFTAIVRPMADPIVEAAVDVYGRIAQELLPTPAKSHYVFNLRDLSKCIQGVLQAESSTYVTELQLQRLYYHESMRVFHDRLINEEDKTYFKGLMAQTQEKYFGKVVVQPDELVIFGDFMVFGQSVEDRIYEEIKDMEKLKSILFDYLEDYIGLTGIEMRLILFQDAIEHIIRLARLLRAERGNGLLVGVSGMGKQSLTRLGSHINGYKCVQIELSRGYDQGNFHEDLRKFYWQAGVLNNPTVFLITDTQIVKEEFLEDINNMLNSGEVPNLYEGDEYEKVILGCRDPCMKMKTLDCSRDGIFNFFIKRVQANLHLVICMSPVGDAFRRRCRMFPSLVNCCTIDWFVKWPPEALFSVAVGSLRSVAKNEEQNEQLAKICVMMHESVEIASDLFYEEQRRHYYTTPSSYLELLKLYHNLLDTRKNSILAQRQRIENGLNKILETNELVAVMQVDLEKMFPLLEVQQIAMKQLLAKLAVDTKAADVVKKNVMQDEAEAKVKADECQSIADEASADLEEAMPALKAAEDALNSITKNDINELKSFTTPPALVQFVMESVCILLNAKPTWESAKKLLNDVNFMKKLLEYDKEHIPQKTLAKVKKYIDHKDFDPAKIEKVSRVAKSVCLWVIAMDKFSGVYKVVEPKIMAHRNAEEELKGVMQILKKKQEELAEVEGQLQKLKEMIDVKNAEFKIIQDDVDLTTGRLNRAGRLTSALSEEEIRWGESVKQLTSELWAVPGDVLVASACVAYLGAFSTQYRQDLAARWVKECRKYEIPSSSTFNLVSVLGEAYEIRHWNMNYLPRDEVSIENGIIVTKALRWPLMIDPQEQANRWIRSMETPNDLRVLKMTDPNLSRILEICIRQGFPLLIEELEESVDPTLGPVLARSVYSQGGRLLIRLGDTAVDYDARFRLYMTTKLSNPHYLPEICIMVTLVNFLVTVSGLEDQLLAEVVAIELPEMEKTRGDLIVRINTDKQQLLMLEDKVLKLLFSSEGNILDDELLVETLNGAKETSAIIAARLIETEKTETVITATREKYRVLAGRGAILFFVVASIGEIDPMYQFSLKYFTAVFCAVIAQPHETSKMELAVRLGYLMEAEVYAIYLNVSRGLFEKHKLILSFLISIAIEKHEGRVSESEFSFLIRGPVGSKAPMVVKSNEINLTDHQWKCCLHLQHEYKEFSGLTDDLFNTINLTLGDFSEEFSFIPKPGKAQKDWTNSILLFQKLMLITSIAEQKLVSAIGAYVRATLGKKFTEVANNTSLPSLYADTNNVTPLIFLLSTGSDPMAAYLRFAQDMNYLEKMHSISLGQGQGPTAEMLIEKGRTFGHWVFLQNCHLATSWMPSLEIIVRNLALGVIKAHVDFRLYLSSMPSRTFPVSVLQNSVKVTNEPPKGLKANLTRALGDLSKDYFEVHPLGHHWRAMVFGICMFHGVILERRKFGPLGWNIIYEFNESDRECGLKTLDVYIGRDKARKIPWDALEYVNGQITWGGRVTDSWDQRCLSTILKQFSSSRILEHGYAYSPSGIYRCPDGDTLEEFKEYTAALPFDDNPEVFGLHENANLVFQTKETAFFINTLLEGQPRSTEGGGGDTSSDDIALDMIKTIQAALQQNISTDNIEAKLVKLDPKGRVPSLTTVLLQEVDRFNKLLKIIHESLITLEKAIKGFVVMSEQLEAVFVAFLNNQVPHMWGNKGYLSTKSLGYWVLDFQYRIDFIQTWVEQGIPRSVWISGLYFPQSFLTGTLQTHARRHNLPIDTLKIDFEILRPTLVQGDIYERHKAGEKDLPPLYAGLSYPHTGIFVHGLFIEGARWEASQGGLVDAKFGELTPRLPAVWFKPCVTVEPKGRYDSPLYKTQVRAGVLSTTGHSTNFVLNILLDSKRSSEFWILRGTALVTGITE